MNCLGCHISYYNLDEFEIHKLNCIIYIYKIKFNNSNLNNSILINIIDIVTLLKLHKIKINRSITKCDLLLLIHKEYLLRKKINVLYNKYNQFYIVEYIYNLINNNKKENYTLNDLINIISELYHMNKYQILHILNIYSKSRNIFTI